MLKDVSVLMAASEALPFIKTGGLADVLGALPVHLSGLNARVKVVIPLYREVAESNPGKYENVCELDIRMGGDREKAAVYKTVVNNNYEIYLIRHDKSFNRAYIYGKPGKEYTDNARRFGLFSRAVVQLIDKTGESYDAVHCHDWQTALIPLLLGGRQPSVFTIHNIGYQGLFPPGVLKDIGLSPDYYHPEGIEFYGRVNFLKAGIIWSDAVTTVSPQYSLEIQSPGHGFGLDGLMRKYAFKLYGILNGADYTQWNPENDPVIATNYHERAMSGKLVCKLELLNMFSLPVEKRTPIIGMTTRLVHQKGIDLVLGALPDLMKSNLQMIILGTGDPGFEKALKKAEAKYPRIKVRIGYDNEAAHKVMAGSDIFLMPSLYEPCGLSQLYSLKYGTVPIVRATGGLKDTVEKYCPDTGEGTGFLFEEEHPSALTTAVNEALEIWKKPDHWRRLVSNGMSRDYSWARSAKSYLSLYRAVAAGKTRTPGKR